MREWRDEMADTQGREGGREYSEFIQKFKPKLTTDDCFTPPIVYNYIASWVAREYGVEPGQFVRPFYPGGDYERAEYPPGCVVVDNPPFSILASIIDFYLARGVRFFLFAPALTVMGLLARDRIRECCVIYQDAGIVYANGAEVRTSFITNLDRRYCVRVSAELTRLIADATASTAPALPKYRYPDEVLTFSVQKIASKGLSFDLPRDEAQFIRQLDSQKPYKKTIYGGGVIMSERAARERAEAERAARERAEAERAAVDVHPVTEWSLSARERAIIDELNDRAQNQ